MTLGWLCFSQLSYAGEVLLDNGDSLQGEIAAIYADRVEWLSPVFGKLNLPKNSIVELISSVPLKLRARDGACYWAGLRQGVVTFECDEDGEVNLQFLAVKEAVRYEGFRKATYDYRGKLSATGHRDSGRVQRQDWNVDTNIFMRHTDFRHDIWLKYRAESQNETELQLRLEASYQFDWFFAPKTFYSNRGSALKDELRFIDSRYAFSMGVGYQFWENRISALSVETGPQYLNETTFDQNDPNITTNESYGSWRLASSFRLLLPRDTRLFSNVEFLQSLHVGDDWEADTDSGLSLPIAGGITADIAFSYDYDNTPPEGVSARDSRLRVGLGYQW